jgi:chaperonin GroEL (HSP60 family)
MPQSQRQPSAHNCCFVQGESARLQSFVGAIAIADLVKTTLGPKGMDKIIQSVSAAAPSEILTVIGSCFTLRHNFAKLTIVHRR